MCERVRYHPHHFVTVAVASEGARQLKLLSTQEQYQKQTNIPHEARSG